MNVKLTLQLDQDVIEKAKLYAKERKQSLSSLVQNYLAVSNLLYQNVLV